MYTLLSLVIDTEPIEFDEPEDLIEYLIELESETVSWLVQEWSGSDVLQSTLIESVRADKWLEMI